jgi:hypothetical protein
MTGALAAALLAAGGSANSPVKLLVMDFEAAGASPELTQATGGIVAHELEQLGVFKVTTGDAVRALIGLERQRELLGCNGGDCAHGSLPQLAGDYVVGGRVSRVGGGFSLELILLDVHKGQRESSDVEKAANEAELLNVASLGAARLVRALLADRTGGLIISATEAGAAIKVDDWTVGTTPLNGQITLPGGPHALRVEKDGFVTFRRDVRIEPDHLREEQVVLVPSPDFIDAYRSRAWKLRLGAYVASGVAVAALALGAGLQVSADKKYGSVSAPNTFLSDRAALQAGDESYRAAATALQTRINNQQTFSAVSFAIAGIAAAGAGFLWIAGDDPGKYDRYRPLKFGVGVAPAGPVLTGKF